jgi:hypothetical protein
MLLFLLTVAVKSAQCRFVLLNMLKIQRWLAFYYWFSVKKKTGDIENKQA